ASRASRTANKVVRGTGVSVGSVGGCAAAIGAVLRRGGRQGALEHAAHADAEGRLEKQQHEARPAQRESDGERRGQDAHAQARGPGDRRPEGPREHLLRSPDPVGPTTAYREPREAEARDHRSPRVMRASMSSRNAIPKGWRGRVEPVASATATAVPPASRRIPAAVRTAFSSTTGTV